MSYFPLFQINGVDLTDARHDQAVSLLTGVDKEIKLVVYREKLVSKEEAEIEPPKGEKVVNFKEPRIIWNQTISTTLPTETVTFSHVSVQEAQPEPSPVTVAPVAPQPPIPQPALPETPVPPLPTVPPPAIPSPTPSPYASAIPASYTYPNQTSPPSQVLHPASSPSLSPRTLSSDWNSPPAVIQPPKFQYPGFNRPQSRTSANLGDKVNKTDTSPNTISDSVTISYSPTVNSSVKSNNVTSSIPTPAVITNSSKSESSDKDREIHSGEKAMTLERQTVTMKMPTPSEMVSVNHVKESKYPIEECVIVKAGGPLGLSIVGGSDHSSQPFGEDEPGIFVSKVSNSAFNKYSGTSMARTPLEP